MKKPKVLKKANFQRGTSDKKKDKELSAMPPGKRRSSNGKVYYEYRKNRSDLKADRKVPVRKHTRMDGEVDVKKHTRQIKPRMASSGSKIKQLSYSEWEGEVIYELEKLLDITTSDAQGIVDVQSFKMQQSWGKGLSAKETAKVIDKASEVKRESKSSILKKAFDLGVDAHKKDIPNNAVKDKRLVSLIANKPEGVYSQEIVSSWNKGWNATEKQKPVNLPQSLEYRGYYIEKYTLYGYENDDYYTLKKSKSSKKSIKHGRLQQLKEYVDKKLDFKKQLENNISKFIKKGDIFYTSWGYDQTNYDYIAVIEVSPSGKTAICQMTKHENKGYSGQSFKQEPIFAPYGEKFRMSIRQFNNEVTLRGRYPFVQGSKRMDTFFKHKKGKIYYETDSQFGH